MTTAQVHDKTRFVVVVIGRLEHQYVPVVTIKGEGYENPRRV